jgi:HK97 gp10 family phage protein
MISVKIQGLPEFLKALNDLPAELEKEIEKALTDAAGVVLERAKSKVPVKTGELRDSLKIRKPKPSGKNRFYLSSAVVMGKAYGVPLELGHKLVTHGKLRGTVKERPFLRPAFDESKEQAAGIIEAAFDKAFKAMEGKT